MAKKVTRKAVKVVGTQQFIDPKSGEVQDFQVINIEERDANFHKFWMFNIIQSLDLIGNQKTRLAFWLIDQMDSENKICMTLRQMAEKTGISLETVRVTMKALVESNFIVKHNIGVYKINPNCIFSGGKQDRIRVLLDYQESQESQEETTEINTEKGKNTSSQNTFSNQSESPKIVAKSQ